jgi:WD40 repeat protein
LTLWSFAGKPLGGIEKAGKASCATFDGKGERIAIAGADRVLRIFDFKARKLKSSFRGHRADISAIAWSPKGAILASVDESGAIILRKGDSGRKWAVLKASSGQNSLTFSPDGLWLATAGDDATVTIWDMTKHRAALLLRGHEARVLDLAFRPDGKGLVSCGEDRSVRLWTLNGVFRTGAELLKSAEDFAKQRVDGLGVIMLPQNRLVPVDAK